MILTSSAYSIKLRARLNIPTLAAVLHQHLIFHAFVSKKKKKRNKKYREFRENCTLQQKCQKKCASLYICISTIYTMTLHKVNIYDFRTKICKYCKSKIFNFMEFLLKSQLFKNIRTYTNIIIILL